MLMADERKRPYYLVQVCKESHRHVAFFVTLMRLESALLFGSIVIRQDIDPLDPTGGNLYLDLVNDVRLTRLAGLATTILLGPLPISFGES